MNTNKEVRYVLKRVLTYYFCCSLLVSVSLPGLARADNNIGKETYRVVRTRQNKENRERLEKERRERLEEERRKMERKAKTPPVFLGDFVDVKVKKLPGQAYINIIATSPILFETTRGTNGDEIDFLTIEFPFVRLEWSEGKQKTVEVDHGGIQDITFTELYEPDFRVEVKVKLLPQASYDVYPSPDAKAVVIEVREAVLEEPEEALVEEEAVEEFPPVRVNIDVVDAEIQHVLRILSEQSGLNIVTHSKVRGEVTAHLENMPIETALDVILGTNGLAYRKIDNTILVGPEEQIAKAITTSEVIRLMYINAEAARDMLVGIIEERKLQVNIETNSIIITAVPDKLDEAKRIIREVDKAVAQVQLNAKVIEIGLDAAKNLGLDWSKGIGVTLREEERDLAFGDAAVTTGLPIFDFYQVARTAFEAKLNVLVGEGHARILSSPRVITMKDSEATIFIGDRIPYTITSVSGGVVTTEVRFIEPGIRLNITPKIINDNFVIMDIAPEVSYIYGFRGPKDEYPWVKTREAKASVRINNGETLVLGGLLSKEEKNVITKVPVLSSIPLLGEVFKNTKLVEGKTELLIVVTPTIIK